jgi:thiol-disulfide isomerase/thioredoxin
VTILVALAIAFHWDIFLEQRIAQVVPTLLPENNSLVNEQLQEVIKKELSSVKDFPVRKAPELMGVTNWINSPPLSLGQLKGKVVLLDFWTYSCINCLRTLPYVEGWYKKYKDDGLVVIGIHTPEFEFEKDPDNVIEAVHRLGITYPVAQDNAYMVWNAYQNQFWPAHYLIDRQGNVVQIRFGEGGYVELEKTIQRLLGVSENFVQEKAVGGREISPETYLGTRREDRYTSENKIIPSKTVFYSYSSPLQDDQVGLKGYWRAQEEYITSESNESFLEYNFLAQRVYLVLSGSSKYPLEIFLDGRKVSQVTVTFAQKYDIASTTYGRHLLSIKVPKGIRAYAFTFGDE